MADLDASQDDYRQALTWLDLYAEHRRLPGSYERKRKAWIRRVRGAGAGTRPRAGRRRTILEPTD